MRYTLLTAMLGFAVMQSAATAQQAQNGVIRVTVRERGASEPIAGVQVTLSGPVVAVPVSPPPPPPPPPSPPPASSTTPPAGAANAPAGVIGGVSAAVTAQIGTLQAPVNPSPASSTKAVTDQNGNVSFDHLTPGRYTIQAQRDGYLGTLPAGLTAALLLAVPTSTSSTVMIGPQQLSQDVSMSLVRAATISGRVRDAHGVPMSTARVSIGVLGYRDGHRTVLSGPSAQADSQGNYRLSPLNPGEYYVRLEQGAARGIGAYYPGVMDIEKATLVPIRGGEEVVGLDFDIPNIPTFKISGTVLNVPQRTLANGQPDTTVPSFSFVSADPKNVDPVAAPLIPNALRGSDGRFEISGFPAGVWDIFPAISTRNLLAAAAAGGTIAPATPGAPNYATGRARVVITDRDVEGVTIAVGSSDLKGRVVMQGAGPTGAASTQPIRISLLPREDMPSPLISHIRTAQTLDAGGAFTFMSVPPGEYRVQVSPMPAGYYLADLRLGSKSIYDDGIISVGTTPLEPLEITFNANGGAVALPGMPITGRAVAVPTASRRQNPLLYGSRIAIREPGGARSIMDLAPGDYKVFVWESLPTGGAEQNPEFIARYEEFGTPVTVTAGQTSSVDVKMIPADR